VKSISHLSLSQYESTPFAWACLMMMMMKGWWRRRKTKRGFISIEACCTFLSPSLPASSSSVLCFALHRCGWLSHLTCLSISLSLSLSLSLSPQPACQPGPCTSGVVNPHLPSCISLSLSHSLLIACCFWYCIALHCLPQPPLSLSLSLSLTLSLVDCMPLQSCSSPDVSCHVMSCDVML
jgi:hypothetical protein